MPGSAASQPTTTGPVTRTQPQSDAEQSGTGRQGEPGDGRELFGAVGTERDGRLGRGEIDVAAIPAR